MLTRTMPSSPTVESRQERLARKEVAGVVLLVAMLLAAFMPNAAMSAAEFRGKVVGVSDGDTITVLHDRRPEKVRLNGVDAPEKGQPFGEKARQFTARLAFGQEVIVRVVDHDRHGRTVADVILADGRSLNQELVRAGYEWWYRRYSKDFSLSELEAQARLARSGLWADQQPTPPWEWRRNSMNKRPAAGLNL
jgi:endonuclease YncB( thermonuclease family)